MDETQRVREEVPDQAYFSMIPHILDEALNPYELRLYTHYRRVCGEGSRGKCYEKTATTANRTFMSHGQVVKTRQALADLGIIRKTERKVRNLTRVDVTIVDIWQLNMAYFSSHPVTGGVQRSPHDRYQSLHDHYQSLHDRYRSLCDRLRNNLDKEEPREEEPRKEKLSDDDGGLLSTLPVMDAGGVQGGVTVGLVAMRNFAAESAELSFGGDWDGRDATIASMDVNALNLLVEWLDHMERHYQRLVMDEKLDNPIGFMLSQLAKGKRPGLTTKQRQDLHRRIAHYAELEAMP